MIEVLRQGLSRGLDLTLSLAGQPIDASVAVVLDRAQAEFGGRIKQWGFVSGESKDDFLGSIDWFVFPSRYANEAEPIVVLEALAHGVPCVTGRRLDALAQYPVFIR